MTKPSQKISLWTLLLTMKSIQKPPTSLIQVIVGRYARIVKYSGLIPIRWTWSWTPTGSSPAQPKKFPSPAGPLALFLPFWYWLWPWLATLIYLTYGFCLYLHFYFYTYIGCNFYKRHHRHPREDLDSRYLNIPFGLQRIKKLHKYIVCTNCTQLWSFYGHHVFWA